jgi:hypothetical protein
MQATIFAAAIALTFEAYSAQLVQALVAGAKVKEMGRYTPPADVQPKHTVRVFDLPDGKTTWYVSIGFGIPAQHVELATYVDRKDERVAELLSLIGEAMLAQANGHPYDAWSYDTITLSTEVHGLRTFVLRPGAELEIAHEKVSIFTVIPLDEAERREVVNVGAEKARAWVEKRAVGDPDAMLARWRNLMKPRR